MYLFYLRRRSMWLVGHIDAMVHVKLRKRKFPCAGFPLAGKTQTFSALPGSTGVRVSEKCNVNADLPCGVDVRFLACNVCFI